MTIALLFIHDGRDSYAVRSLLSALEMLPRFDLVVEIDDREHELGFAGAIQAGWKRLAKSGVDWVFHLEGDFVFNEPPPLYRMIALLKRQPHLAQVSLKRQPWNDRESAAGGIVEADPDDFVTESDGLATWTEHSKFFTTNPSVYSSQLCWRGWPDCANSEGIFTHQLVDEGKRFAIWGPRLAPPKVEHIGVRAGAGY